jgi:hypothetical protein
MKSYINNLFKALGWKAIFCLFPLAGMGQGIPEPSLIIYGTIRNSADGNVRLTAGPLTWQISPSAGGPTNIFVTTLTNINDQFSYILRVPWETDVGSGISSNTLRLISTPLSYDRSQVFLGTNQVTFLQPAQANFSVSWLDRGRIERVDLQVAIPCIDSDGNGLCDWWELLFFGRLGVNPNADADGDGLSNLAEYRAGTDPIDPNSVFKFIDVTNDAAGGIRVEWSSVAGRVYTLQRSSSLLTGFTDLQQNIQATEPKNTYRDTNAAPPGPYFYRLRLQP